MVIQIVKRIRFPVKKVAEQVDALGTSPDLVPQ